jgi:hypothetical protein
MTIRLLSLAFAAVLASSGSAPAQTSKPFGQGFDNWTFSRTDEGRGVTNCRAGRRIGGRDDIIALKTDRRDYVSVRAEGRKGKWRESFIVPFREPKNGRQYDGVVEADGKRMWMMLDRNAIETLVQRGGYQMYLGGSEDTDRAPLGAKAVAAFIRLKECIVASGG